jgi:hypothetical protein
MIRMPRQATRVRHLSKTPKASKLKVPSSLNTIGLLTRKLNSAANLVIRSHPQNIAVVEGPNTRVRRNHISPQAEEIVVAVREFAALVQPVSPNHIGNPVRLHLLNDRLDILIPNTIRTRDSRKIDRIADPERDINTRPTSLKK